MSPASGMGLSEFACSLSQSHEPWQGPAHVAVPSHPEIAMQQGQLAFACATWALSRVYLYQEWNSQSLSSSNCLHAPVQVASRLRSATTEERRPTRLRAKGRGGLRAVMQESWLGASQPPALNSNPNAEEAQAAM